MKRYGWDWCGLERSVFFGMDEGLFVGSEEVEVCVCCGAMGSGRATRKVGKI